MTNLLKNIIFIVTSSLLILSFDCSGNSNEIENREIVSENLDSNSVEIEEDLPIVLETTPRINYSFIVIQDKQQLDSIRQAFEETEENPALNKMFCTLNRKERRFLRVGDTVVVADSVAPDMTAYSIFPEYYDGAKDIKKIIMLSAKYQAYACYEYGKLVRFAATNTGKERTPSYPGRYAMVWKSELRISSLDSTWKMPYTWNIHKQAGSAFHKFEMPGYPASHSCMRQFMDDAKWLFKWGEGEKYDSVRQTRYMTGTPVIVIDHFDFTPPIWKPWVSLRSNKDIILQLPDKPMEVEEALIPISQIPHVARGGLIHRERYLYAEDTLRARGVIREGVHITESVDFNKRRQQRREAKARELEKKQQLEEKNLIED